MSGLSLVERIVAIDRALIEVDHAFGGALALAYYAEPRATIDIDLNVFVPVDRFAEVATPLVNLGVSFAAHTTEAIVRRDGQVRVMWDATPIDLFFSYDRFHQAAAGGWRRVPFAKDAIPILAPEHLIVCKVIFDRPKDWVDIDAIVAAGTPVDLAEVLRWVGRIAGDDDLRYERVAAALIAGLSSAV